jgi:hypothetical protein
VCTLATLGKIKLCHVCIHSNLSFYASQYLWAEMPLVNLTSPFLTLWVLDLCPLTTKTSKSSHLQYCE